MVLAPARTRVIHAQAPDGPGTRLGQARFDDFPEHRPLADLAPLKDNRRLLRLLGSAMSPSTLILQSVLTSQYHAALAMLREAIERCPADVWLSTAHKNAFWQIAYHTLFFTHLYLQRNEAEFRRWAQHQGEEDGIAGDPYTQAQVLEYWSVCDGMVDRTVDSLDLESPESGFWWYKVSKLEHQLVNLRHVQHHAAQLADRLRAAENIGIRWVSAERQ